MPRLNSMAALGEKATVHMLEFDLDAEVLGGLKASDPYDSDRLREAANLIKRVCSKQSISGAHAISSLRDGGVHRIQCGFETANDRDAIADYAVAQSGSADGWASRRYFLLDLEKVEHLITVGIPRDNRGPGRKARERARDRARESGPHWILR